MKKELMASTALVGAALLMAAPALADKHNVTHAKRATAVTLTGGFDVQAGFTDQDVQGFSDQRGTADSIERGYGFHTNSEIAVRAKGQTDAGMKWSAKAELEVDTDSDGNTDELQITFSGSWGTLVMGNEDGPEDLMEYGSEQAIAGAGTGGTGGDYKDWANITSVNSRLHDEPSLESPVDSSDSTKIVYYTPRINGLQLGVGYVPDTDASGQSSQGDDDSKAQTFFGLGGNYVQKFGDVSVKIGATGGIGEAENPSEEDVRGWKVGGVLGFGAWSIGAGYQDTGDSLRLTTLKNDDAWSVDVGIGYKQGPVKLGLGWLHAETGAGTSGTGTSTVDLGDDEHDVVTLGATYALGKGVVVYAEGFYYDSEAGDSSRNTSNDAGPDNEAWGLIIGTTVKF